MKPEKNLVYQPFAIISASLAVFITLSFVSIDKEIFGYKIKEVDLFSEIRFERKLHETPWPGLVFDQRSKDSLGVMIKLRDRLSVINYTPDKFGAMAKFYEALIALENKEGESIHIGYFGDSMIEGDLLTMDLRNSFQKKFGGRGVGFVSITSIVAGFRTTIRHSFSNDWSVYHFNNSGGADHPAGPSGYSYSAGNGSNVTYKSTGYSGQFSGIHLYYGAGDSSGVVKSKVNGSEMSSTLDGKDPVNRVVIHSGSTTGQVNSAFFCRPEQNIYGFSFEGGKGVYLDNYAFRGNSGLALTTVPKKVYQGFSSLMNYKLIVLHYGLNVVSHDIKDYSWYEKGLKNVIDHLKESFPEASILVVSVNDKCYRFPTGWETEPDVPILVETQRKIAEEKQVAFWNLYENMGGYNSIKGWVEGDTVYANKDYTHLNGKGAKQVADMLYGKIMTQYELYKKMKVKK